MAMRTVAKLPDHIITKAIDAYQRQPAEPHPCPACDATAALRAALPGDMPEPLRELALRHAELERQGDEIEAWYQEAQERLEDEDLAFRQDRLHTNDTPEIRAWIARAAAPHLSPPDARGSQTYLPSHPAWLS